MNSQETTIPQRALDYLKEHPETAPQFDGVFGEGSSGRILGQAASTPPAAQRGRTVFEVIPQEAIDHLTANPTTAAQFDGVFGKGRAAEVIAAQDPSPTPMATDEEDDDWSVIGESLRAVVGGVRDAAHETANFAQWVDTSVNDAIFGENRVLSIGSEGITVQDRADTQFVFGDEGSLELPEVAPNQTLVGGFARGVTQFAAGYATFSKLTRLNGIKGALLNGALADAIVFNPEDPNITKVLEEFDIDTGVFGEVLATDPDDPEWMNRLRNAGEGLVAGAVAEAIGWGIRARRAKKAGDAKGEKKATEEQLKALEELNGAIKEAAGDAKVDIDETIKTEKTLFGDKVLQGPAPKAPDGEGQFSLDLGDTPLPKPKADAEPVAPNRIYLTPEKVEKIRLQAALAKGHPSATKASQLSFRSPRTQSSFEAVLDDMAGTTAVLADEFAKIKGGDVQRWASVRAQSAAQLRQIAQMTGDNVEDVIARFQTANGGDMPKLAAEIHTQSRVVLTLEQELKDMAKVISDAAAGKEFNLKAFPEYKDLDELRMAFNLNRELAANLLGGLDSSRANIARAMNAMKMAKKGDANMRKMIRNPDAFTDIDAAAKALADPENAGKPTMSVIENSLSLAKEIGNRINTFRINALLSGPGTQEVNFISNAIQTLVIPTGQFAGSVVSGNPKMATHALRQLQGSFAAMLDFQNTWKQVAKAGWENEGMLDPFNGKVEGDVLEQVVTGSKAIDSTITLPSRFLMTMDELFKQSQYRGRIFADANAEAAEKGLTGQARTDHIQQYLKDSYGDAGEALRGDALLQARRATFTEPLEPGVASMIQQMAIKQPLLRFFLPFIRTPVNIFSQTFQHFPVVGVISKRMRADFAAGGVRRAQAYGRQALGTALVASAGYLAAEGKITGAGPSDPRIRKVWLKNNQPYSFRIDHEGGAVEFVSFARLEPLSNVFSIAADIVEIKNDKYNEAEAVPMAQALLISVMENTINKTFTQGIADAMKMMTGRPAEQARAARNFVASFVPNVLNQTNGDESLREIRSVTDAILARTHLYNRVDPKRNVLGEPIVRTLPKYDPLGLSEADRRDIDPVLEEITKVAILNQSVSEGPSRRLAGPNQIDLSEIPYSDKQSVYDRWQELTGTVKIGGRTLRQELERVIDSRAYKVAPEGTIGVTEKTKGAIIRRVIEGYRKKAQGEFPELQEIIKAEKQGTGAFLKAQVKRNRELFPNSGLQPATKRSFEDLLK